MGAFGKAEEVKEQGASELSGPRISLPVLSLAALSSSSPPPSWGSFLRKKGKWGRGAEALPHLEKILAALLPPPPCWEN